jgi:hypothetical protein
VTTSRVLFVAASLALVLDGGCAKPSLPPPTTTTTTKTIGAAGGTVVASDGTKIEVPAGALHTDTAITITPAADAPDPPAGTVAVGQAYVFGPEGTTFAVPVTVTLAFDPAKVPTFSDVVIMTAPVTATEYTSLATKVVDATHVSAETPHFSIFRPVAVAPAEGEGEGEGDPGEGEGEGEGTAGEGEGEGNAGEGEGEGNAGEGEGEGAGAGEGEGEGAAGEGEGEGSAGEGEGEGSSCSAGEHLCASGCVPIDSPQDCGSCGVVCQPDQVCIGTAPSCVTALTITSISPSSAPFTGLQFVITGTGFEAGATVTFGGAAATAVSVTSSTSISGVSPPNPNVGAVDVVVTNPDGQSVTLANGYQYLPTA